MRFSEALAELDARQPEHMPEPSLDRIRQIASLLDDPQLRYPTIHVTGTNGKTTTARVAAAVACAHGITTGLYTSPHLESVTERTQVCGEAIGEAEFADEYAHLLPYLRIVDPIGEVRVTYFEAITALAFLWFADKPVSLAVFEVGMGGTWDATNLVAGDVAVLCPIGLDHPELGSTVEEVATEKAGIVKPGKVAVVRAQPPEALRVIEARCEEYEVRILLEDRDWALGSREPGVGGQMIGVRGRHGTYEDLTLPLFGVQAAANTAAAIVAVESVLDRPLDGESVGRAIAGVTTPGRLEVVGRRPLIVLDGAHNPAAAEALATALREAFTWDRLHLVLAVFSNKDLGGIVRHLAPLADRAYAATTTSVRARPMEQIAAALAEEGVPVERHPSVAAAIVAAREAARPDDLILVTGSLYTVADARRSLGSVDRPSSLGKEP
jgi:dihydrofolate synthase / folylpolyglutamate synthase